MNKIIYLILASVLSVSTTGITKLHVAIYYESLCPDSIQFITNQLAPIYEHIENYVDIFYVPFGKSKNINNGESFVCQHGPDECAQNRMQSCALHLLNGLPALQTQFVICQMQFNVDGSGQECADQVHLNFDNLLNCYNSITGTRLQLDAEKLTNRFAPKFVPTIIFNHKFDQGLQDRSVNNFLSVVCNLINNAATICSEIE